MPYLEWNNEEWELAEYYKNSLSNSKWLSKNKDKLPTPKYHLGQIVQFKWSNPENLTGEIRQIGLFDLYDDFCFSYSIYANGHSRQIFYESEIIKVIK